MRIRSVATGMLLAAVLGLTGAEAAPLGAGAPIAAVSTGRDAGLVFVRGGCGFGAHRGWYGRCRYNRGWRGRVRARHDYYRHYY